jgi:hypothetical protein
VKRILMVLAIALVIAALLAVEGAPAFAAGNLQSCQSSLGKSAGWCRAHGYT